MIFIDCLFYYGNSETLYIYMFFNFNQLLKLKSLYNDKNEKY